MDDLIAVFRGKTCAGAIAIGATSAAPCFDVVHASKGHKFVSLTTFPLDPKPLAHGASIPLALMRQSPTMLSYIADVVMKARRRGIRTKTVYGTTLMDNEVSRVLYRDFLGKALAGQRYMAAPPPVVVGRGLASIQPALDQLRDGVSAAKLVVSL